MMMMHQLLRLLAATGLLAAGAAWRQQLVWRGRVWQRPQQLLLSLPGGSTLLDERLHAPAALCIVHAQRRRPAAGGPAAPRRQQLRDDLLPLLLAEGLHASLAAGRAPVKRVTRASLMQLSLEFGLKTSSAACPLRKRFGAADAICRRDSSRRRAASCPHRATHTQRRCRSLARRVQPC